MTEVQITSLEKANSLKARFDSFTRIIKNLKSGQKLKFEKGDVFMSNLNQSSNPTWNRRMREVIVKAMNEELSLIEKEFNALVKEKR